MVKDRVKSDTLDASKRETLLQNESRAFSEASVSFSKSSETLNLGAQLSEIISSLHTWHKSIDIKCFEVRFPIHFSCFFPPLNP